MLWTLSILAALAQDAEPETAPATETATATESEMPDAAVPDNSPSAPPVPTYPDLPGTPDPGGPHFDLEVLYYQQQYDSGLALARERIEANPQDPAPYWMLGRFLFEMSETYRKDDTSVNKMAVYTEMRDAAETALRIDPENTHALFARGIANARLGTTRGVLASLWSAKGIERDWIKVASDPKRYSSLGGNEMLPCDANLALGIFYRIVPDWFIVQVLAGTRGDLDKSLFYLQQSVDGCPGRIGPTKELGATQLCIGERRSDDKMTAAGKETLQSVLRLPPKNDTDHLDHTHSKMLLGAPGLSCEYSRDGQQNLDRADLEQ